MKALVIVARGLHLGYLGCYGNDWVATPVLDRLAAEGVVFDQHFADAPDAAGAARSWRTGRYQFPLPGGQVGPPQPAPNLFALLRQQGIVTCLITDQPEATPGEFAAGWDHVAQVPPDGIAQAVDSTLHRIAGRERWLAWVDLSVLLPPWQVPQECLDPYFFEGQAEDEDGEDDERTLEPLLDPEIGPLATEDEDPLPRLQRSYAAAVTHLDEGLGLLQEVLHGRGLLDEVLLLVTSDRGLPLGEHGIIGDCRPWLHDELIHIPLVVRLPGGAEANRRVMGLSQAVDLMPTLLDAFGIPLPPEVHGRSLLPLMRGEAEQVRGYACAGRSNGEEAEWCLRSADWGFRLPLAAGPEEAERKPQLYVKPDDRWEVNDVAQHYLEFAEQLEQTLRAFVDAARRPGPFQPPELPSPAEAVAEKEAPEPSPDQGGPPP